MSTSAVIGLGFGDEGKGVVTDFLCSRHPDTAVVRFSGGQQCGHKVVMPGLEHVFSNFGSGTLRGCQTFWSEYCTFDPVGFWREYVMLVDKGVSPSITLHPDCPVTTIYDVIMNRQSPEVEYGTTGTGFFRTKKRHIQDGVKLTIEECLLDSWDVVMSKLEGIRDYYNLNDRINIGSFISACFEIRNLIRSKLVSVQAALPAHENLVFEGSQGLMLDEHIGEFPHVTPSDVTPHNALNIAGTLDDVYLVSRVYQTRHGNGPMTNLAHPVHPDNTEKETNHHNRYQGEFRTTVLDLDQLTYAKCKGIDEVLPETTRVHLVLTCLDQMKKYRASQAGRILEINDATDFAFMITRSLKLTGDIYINCSPYSNTIRQL